MENKNDKKIRNQSLFIGFEGLQRFWNVTNSEKTLSFNFEKVTVICRHRHICMYYVNLNFEQIFKCFDIKLILEILE